MTIVRPAPSTEVPGALVLSYRDFGIFYLLCFLFLAPLPIFALVLNGGNLDFSSAATSASELTGIEWGSNIISAWRLARLEPILFLTLLGSLAPTFAAITTLLLLGNKGLWAAFRARFRLYNGVTALEALAIYFWIFALLVTCLFMIFELRTMLGLDYARSVAFGFSPIMAILAIAFLDQGALLEEAGWRGFASPELEKLMASPLLAALVIGLLWGLWHLPRDIATGVTERLGVSVYILEYMPSFILGTVSVSIIACYFMNRLGGSILAAIIVHGITNDAIGIAGAATMSEALTPVHQLTKNLPFAVIAACLALLSRGSLGARKDAKEHARKKVE